MSYPVRFGHGDPKTRAPRAAGTAFALVLVSLILGPASGSAHPLFPEALYASGSNPRSIAVGDLNGDQKRDVVTVGAAGLYSYMTVLLGNGDGTLGPPNSWGVGNSPSSVAIGDLDGNGTMDVAVANGGSNTALVLLGNGDGTFGAQVSYPTGLVPRSVVIGDLNGDGNPDLVVAGGTNTVAVLLGIGDGTFGLATEFGTGLGPCSAAIRDLNADGNQDVAVANRDANTVSVLLGNGDGTLAAVADLETGSLPTSLAVGDLDSDGNLDLAVANQTSRTISVLLGNGGGTFGAKVDFATGADHPFAVEIGDLNGDQRPDLVVGNDGNRVSVLLGNGNGTFGTMREFGTGSSTVSLRITDLNRDGRADLVAASDAVFVLIGNGDGTFVTRAEYQAGSSPSSVAMGDLSEDGNPDLVVANANSNTVSVLLGNANGTFGAKTDFGTGTNPRFVGIAEVSGDGNLDLVVANGSSSTVSVLLGDGEGSFGAKTDFTTGDSPRFVAIGDVNGDGAQDLAVAGSLGVVGTVSVLLGYGNGSFHPRTDWDVSAWPVSLAVTDLNGDENLDIVALNSVSDFYCAGSAALSVADDRTVSVLIGNGDGTFQVPVGSYSDVFLANSMALGDLNGDGDTDIAIPSYFDDGFNCVWSTISVMFGNGDGTFAWGMDLGTPFGPTCVAIRDLDGDGNADLVTGSIGYRRYSIMSPSLVSVLPGNGDGTFGASTYYASGTGPVSLAVGDVNADGRPDLVTADNDSNMVSVLLGMPDLVTSVEAVNVPRVQLSASVIPNPLSPSGMLQFITTQSGPARIRVFDVQGRLVRTLVDTPSLQAGKHEIVVDGHGSAGERLGAGVYFFRIEAVDGSSSGRIVMLK
jgi:hypothetical protein